MTYTDSGAFSVRAYSASEAVPIEGGTVIISGATENNGDVKYSLVTDEDGVTETVSLPAPPRSNSLSPTDGLENSALYDVTVSAEGYYTKKYYNVPVFAGVEAILPVNMIAISEGGDGILYPRGNINAIFEDTEGGI